MLKMLVEMKIVMVIKAIMTSMETIMVGPSYVPVAGTPQKKSHLTAGKVTLKV